MDINQQLQELKKEQAGLCKKQIEDVAKLQIYIEDSLGKFKDIPGCTYHLEKISRHLTDLTNAHLGVNQSVKAICDAVDDYEKKLNG